MNVHKNARRAIGDVMLAPTSATPIRTFRIVLDAFALADDAVADAVLMRFQAIAGTKHYRAAKASAFAPGDDTKSVSLRTGSINLPSETSFREERYLGRPCSSRSGCSTWA
jgi:hypothetical protein